MAIDYSGFAIPKRRVKALDKADQVKALEKLGRAENAKAKQRAKGQCEVRRQVDVSLPGYMRCTEKDAHTHHLISGIGRRNKGKSILAEWKLRVCQACHADIHAKVLRPTSSDADAATVRFWRAK